MPNPLDFSCKSPIAVAELALSCETEGEQRQPAKIFPSPGFLEVLWCAAPHLLSPPSTCRGTAMCLLACTPVCHLDTLLCAQKCCATSLPCHEQAPCCL